MAQRKIFGDGPCLQAELSFKTLLGRGKTQESGDKGEAPNGTHSQ